MKRMHHGELFISSFLRSCRCGKERASIYMNDVFHISLQSRRITMFAMNLRIKSRGQGASGIISDDTPCTTGQIVSDLPGSR